MATGPAPKSVEPNDWQTVEPNDWQTVGASAGDTPPGPKQSPFMRGYSAVGEEIKGFPQGIADVTHDIITAVSKPGGLKELQKKYPPTHDIWKTLAQAYGGLNPAAVKRDAQGNILWPETIGATVGRLLMLGGVPEAREVGAEGAEAVKSATELPRTMARSYTHTAERQTRQFVADTIKANEKAKAAAEAANAAKQERAADINARRAETFEERKAKYEADKTKVEEANKQAQTEYETAKAEAEKLKKDAADTETRRGDLARQTQQQGTRLINRIRQVQEKTKAKLDEQFEQVREKANETPLDPEKKARIDALLDRSSLVADVTEARNFIQGTTEVPKVFKDIINKETEGLRELSGGRGAMSEGALRPGNPVYDRLVETGQIQPPKPSTYNELQGYVSEIGRELSKGTLPGDIFQAYKALQEKLLDRMETIANIQGVGAMMRTARSGYARYMQTFFEPVGPRSSALAKALRERLPENAIPHLSGAEDVRDIRTKLAEFDPGEAGQGGAAKLYDNYLSALREYRALPKEGALAKAVKEPTPPKPKEPPVAPKPPKPIVPKPIETKITKVGTSELDKAKRAALEASVNSTDRFGGWILPMTIVHMTLGALKLNGALFLTSFLDIPAYLWTREKIAQVLEKPGVEDWITKPTPGDIRELMKLPPEYRGVIQQRTADIVKAQLESGRRVSPQLLGFIAGQATTPLAPRRNPSDEWSNPQP